MRVQELDPGKRYIVSVNNDNMTEADALRLKAEVEKYCLGAIVMRWDTKKRRYVDSHTMRGQGLVPAWPGPSLEPTVVIGGY